jgi:hypothetical protein
MCFLPAIERALVEGKEDIGVRKAGEMFYCGKCSSHASRTEIEGVVVTFQSVNRIQELESRIRRKIFLKGHTAK